MLKRGGWRKKNAHNPILCQSAFRGGASGEGQKGRRRWRRAKGIFLSLEALELCAPPCGRASHVLAAVLGQGVGTAVLVAG